LITPRGLVATYLIFLQASIKSLIEIAINAVIPRVNTAISENKIKPTIMKVGIKVIQIMRIQEICEKRESFRIVKSSPITMKRGTEALSILKALLSSQS
jgi:hypothetical protein